MRTILTWMTGLLQWVCLFRHTNKRRDMLWINQGHKCCNHKLNLPVFLKGQINARLSEASVQIWVGHTWCFHGIAGKLNHSSSLRFSRFFYIPYFLICFSVEANWIAQRSLLQSSGDLFVISVEVWILSSIFLSKFLRKSKLRQLLTYSK